MRLRFETMTKEEQVLQDLILDSHWPSDLAEWSVGANMFDILGMTRAEIRHSYMLAWLLSPNGSHGLGDAFIECFVKRIVQCSKHKVDLIFLSHNWSNAFVTREWGNSKRRLDILVESYSSAQESLVIAIENKIDSKDRKGQLDDYRKEVLEVFSGNGNQNRHLFVYLTPSGDVPINIKDTGKDVWINVPYFDVLSALEDVMTSKRTQMTQNVFTIIADYKFLIRRNIVKDFNLQKCCQSLYEKHKEAFDLIYRNADMDGAAGEVKRTLKRFLKEFCEGSDGKYLYTGDCKGSQSILSFQSKRMNEILPKLSNEMNGSWGNKDVYYYWFDVNSYNSNVRLIVEFGISNADKTKDVMVKLGGIIKPKKNLKEGRYHRMDSINVCSFGDDFNGEKVIARVRSAIMRLEKKEGQWLAEFNKREAGTNKEGK